MRGEATGGSRWARWSLVAMGVLAAAVALGLLASALPSDFNYSLSARWPRALHLNGLTWLELFRFSVRALLLGAAVLLVALGAAPLFERLRVRVPPPLFWAASAVALCLFAALFVFRGVPIVDDEATYRMQAELLRHGRLMDPPVPPSEQWHREPFTVFTPKGTTGKYLFGEPLVLVPGLVAGFAPLLHLLLLGGTVLLAAAQVRRRAGEKTARIAAALLALSPMLLFTSATLQSEAPALFALAVAVWALERGRARDGILAGLALGFCLAVRPQVAAPCGAVLLLRYGWSRPRFFAAVALAALPWMAAVLAYNHAVTGSALTLPGAFYNDEPYGFARISTIEGYFHTPLKGIALTLVALARLNAWSLGWPWSLAGPIAWALWRRPAKDAVAPWGWIALATFLFQLGYYFVGISETGPVYHYAAVPFVAISTAAAVTHGLERWPGRTAAAVALSVLLGTATFLVEHAVRLRRLTDVIGAPFALGPIEPPALVFVERSLVGSDRRGEVRGVPLRTRDASDPVVFYPRPSVAPAPNAGALEAVRRRWPERRCYYARVAGGRWRLDGCDDIARAGAELDRLEPPWF